MKNILSILFCYLLFTHVWAQTTEEYFTRPGLNINANHTGCCGSAHNSAYFYAGPSTNCSANGYRFARQDGHNDIYLEIEGRKVYILAPFCHKVLFYDFGLVPGDIVSEGFYSQYLVTDTSRLLLLNGELRFRIDLRLNNRTSTWVEGIGDIQRSLFPENDFEGIDVFICARDSTGDLWFNPEEEENCSFYTDVVDKKDEDQISVYPNPVSQTLYFSSTTSFEFDAFIYSATGVLQAFQTNPNAIEVTDLPPGLYLLVLTSFSDGRRMVKKIMIAR